MKIVSSFIFYSFIGSFISMLYYDNKCQIEDRCCKMN